MIDLVFDTALFKSVSMAAAKFGLIPFTLVSSAGVARPQDEDLLRCLVVFATSLVVRH